MSDQIHLLKTRRFLPLFITQFFGAFNDNAFKNALLIWFTYDLAIKTGQDAQIVVTLAAGLFILPFFLFSALAGNFADKFEKSKLVQKIKQVEILLMLLCFVGFHFQNLNFLLAILFFMGIQSTFFGPLKYSLLPLHLKDDELISGNGIIEGGTFISILLGTIVGGLVIRTHYGVEIICAGLILFAVVGYFASRFIPESKSDDPNLKINFNIFVQTWKIVNFAKKEKTVWLSIIGISWFWLIGATFLTQFPVYAKNVIGGDERIVTFLLSIFSIGIALGSVLCNKLLKGKIDGGLVPHGSLGITISIISFFVFGALYQQNHNLVDVIGVYEFLFANIYGFFISLSLLSLSIFSGIYIVPLYAIMQHRSDEKYLARIIAANNVINALFMVLSSIVAILLFSLKLKVDEILLIVGILNLGVFFVVKKLVKNAKLGR
jgi:acyl-[acyl-carrier-protein]-phospholipid O-acyltransferase/long-chain-fatty-acid--[acyl-carrier-protein] ligase